MIVIFIIVGLLIGASLEGINGAVLGAFFGGVAGFIFKLQEQLKHLSFKHNKLQDDFSRLSQHYEKHQFEINDTAKPEANESSSVDDSSLAIEKEDFDVERESVTTPIMDQPSQQEPLKTPVPHFDNEINNTVKVTTKAPETKPQQSTREPASSYDKEPNPVFTFVHNFIFTGNPIVKIASVVLFFGVAFLLKYAAEQNYFPIQWRFISVALIAIALLVWGLKLTPRKRQYGLVIQGLSIGILYLTTYAASSLYPLMPLNLAFLCLLILSVISAILSVKQDAPSLAIIAVIGGFLAPILTSSGSNAYVKLFSYYAILNLGILFISLFKSWRFLCWLGFAFTFVIGSLWGYQSYRPAFFDSTEPFLLFHFLLYLIIPILFLRLKHLPAKPIIQTTVVFGLPTISFLLQLHMVQNIADGNTYSALGWSMAYFLAALAIHFLPNTDATASKSLKISYLGIAITFFSIFIFFLFEQDVTSVLWALEAVGLTWLGIRQKEFFPKLAGWLLIALSALLYLEQYNPRALRDMFFNAQFISGIIVAFSALTMGWFYSKSATSDSRLAAFEQGSSTLLLVASTLLIFTLGLNEFNLISIQNYLIPSIILLTTIICALYFVVGKFINWKLLQQSSLLLIPALTLLTAIHFIDDYMQNPMAFLGFIAYPSAITIGYGICKLSLSQKSISAEIYLIVKSILYLTGIFIVTWTLANFAKSLSSNGDWYLLAFGIVPMVALFLATKHFSNSSNAPNEKSIFSYIQLALSLYLTAWFLFTAFSALHPNNLPYLPLFNPLELTQALILYGTYKVLQQFSKKSLTFDFANYQYLLFGIGFIFINLVVARSFHHYTAVPFKLTKLLSEPSFLLTLTFVWSLLAMFIMYFARARQSRSLWIIGASLLVAILVKLVLFDMADSGTLARIISFLVVGSIMLAIGYFVPMPPSDRTEDN